MSEDKKDYIDLKKKSLRENIKEFLDREEEACRKAGILFCRRCAKFDIDDKLKKINEEGQRTGKFETFSIETFDLKPYKDKNRFRFEKNRDAIDNVRVGLTNKPILVGHHADYICKERLCGMSVFVPLKDKVEASAK